MQTAIVTGAYGVIGKEIARGLLKQNVRVHLIGRDHGKLGVLKDNMDHSSNNKECHIHAVDLSSKQQIFSLAEQLDAPIDILINNAATAPPRRMENELGIEMQWATNVLGYYWMTRAFEAHLLAAHQPRVINVASYWAGGLDLEDPEFKKRHYNNDAAYRQSKQADRMLAYGLAEEYKGKISINACHSGDANSKFATIWDLEAVNHRSRQRQRLYI